MQKKQQPVQEVKKPILQGSWHGRDAWKLGGKVLLNVLVVSILYLVLGMMLTFDSLALRLLTSLMLVGGAAAFLYSSGLAVGQTDAAFAEIMYQRVQEGKDVPQADRDRCYHPMKGFFAALVGAAPFFLVALVFAVLTRPVEYALGVLPSWLSGLTRQSEFGDALLYYSETSGMSLVSVLRIICRGMAMPFITVAIGLGDSAVLIAERLIPLFVLVAPLGYGFGYRNGLKARIRINTGIVIGDNKKKRRERKERKKRAQRSPQQLV